MYNLNGFVCFYKNNVINVEYFFYGNLKFIIIIFKIISNFFQLFYGKGLEKFKFGFFDKLKWLEEYVSMI